MFVVQYVVSISSVRRLRTDFEVNSEVHEAWILRKSYRKRLMFGVLNLRMAEMVGRETPSRLPFHPRLFQSISYHQRNFQCSTTVVCVSEAPLLFLLPSVFQGIGPGRTVSRVFRRPWGRRRVGSWSSSLFFCRERLCPSPKWSENMDGICSNVIRQIGRSL